MTDWLGTHPSSGTRATLIYRRAGKLRPCSSCFGRTKIERTVRYLGIEVDEVMSEVPGHSGHVYLPVTDCFVP